MTEVITNNLDLWTSALRTKSTAGRGSNGKLEAYGIKKLRELILELAVRGKLVSQDPNDEPASVLLEKIADEKKRLVREGIIKKQQQLPDVTEAEKPFQLPGSWKWTRLGNVGLGSTGKTPGTGKSEYYGGEIPFVGPGQITPSGEILASDKTLTEEGCEFSTIANPGDILMVCIGGSIGKSAITNSKITFNQQINCLRPIIVSPVLLNYSMGTPLFQTSIMEKATGSATPIINRSKWEELLVPISPLAEQHRIVAKVDELMALCDQLEHQQTSNIEAHQTLVETLLGTLTNSPVRPELVEGCASTSSARTEFDENWTRIADHFDTLFTTEQGIDQLKKNILQLAVMGKLVPQDSSDEPASKLLKKIAAAKALLFNEGNIREQKSLADTGNEEIFFQVPDSWKWVMIDEICHVQGGIQKQPMRQPKTNHYPYLRVANVQRGYITIDEMSRFELYEDELEKWTLRKGDMLVVEGNGSEEEIGRCAIWNGEIENCVYQNHLIRVRPYLPKLEVLISKFLNSPSGIEEMKRLAVTTSGLYNLSVGKIRAISIPLPPIQEQERIVAKVDELMVLCDNLKTRLTDAQTTQIRLADAIVEQAVA